MARCVCAPALRSCVQRGLVSDRNRSPGHRLGKLREAHGNERGEQEIVVGERISFLGVSQREGDEDRRDAGGSDMGRDGTFKKRAARVPLAQERRSPKTAAQELLV